MNPNRVDVALARGVQVAYILFICALVFLLFPPARRAAQAVASGLVWNYQLGSYLMSRRPTPAWVDLAVKSKSEELAQE